VSGSFRIGNSAQVPPLRSARGENRAGHLIIISSNPHSGAPGAVHVLAASIGVRGSTGAAIGAGQSERLDGRSIALQRPR